jgi:very-short-patch-repair endonuclease
MYYTVICPPHLWGGGTTQWWAGLNMENTLRHGADKKKARRLRKQLTKPELQLWLRLRERPGGLVFRNQHALGPYVLDFYCPKSKLCIEVDGETHTHDKSLIHDQKRDQWLKTHGIHVHRIIARDLLANPDETADGVMDLALARLQELKAPPTVASDGPPSP